MEKSNIIKLRDLRIKLDWAQLQIASLESQLAERDKELAASMTVREALSENLAEAREDVDRERLRYGQQMARNARFMSAMAFLARHGKAEWAQDVVKEADAQAAAVRLEDFVVPHLNAALAGEEE